MKLKDYPGFMETMPVLFDHLKKRGVESGLAHKVDFARVLGLLMDSELDTSFYLANWCHYEVYFHDFKCDDNEAYFFVFGSDGEDPEYHFVLLEVKQGGEGFLGLLFNNARMLPMARGLLDSTGRLAITVSDDESGTESVEYEEREIMNEEQFEEFIWSCTRVDSSKFIIDVDCLD
jgi:hypothetical protein